MRPDSTEKSDQDKIHPGVPAVSGTNRPIGGIARMTRMIALVVLAWSTSAWAEEPFDGIAADFGRLARPLLKTYCLECHSADDKQGELDLERFASLAEVRRDPAAWQKVAEMLDHKEMPPKDAKQPNVEERRTLREWVRKYLDAEARASAGDPGPVPLRRLSKAEYTYTVRDLTGVNLDPAREFPADGAAGEGFTNAAAAGVMSPSLLQKYFDAAKDISAHAVLTPTGIEWSTSSSRRDWTEEALAEIRRIYERDTAKSGGSQVNLQGIVFETNGGGRLPVELYIEATLKERDALRAGTKSIDVVAAERKLNPKYLGLLWNALEKGTSSSLLMEHLRSRWRSATPEHADELTKEIASWQRSLFRFASIGHIGKAGGPKAWMESISPLVDRQEIRFPLKAAPDAKDVTVYLATSDAGDGNEHDFAVWEQPRLVAPGRPDILLRDLRSVSARLARRREELLSRAQQCLNAAAEAATQESFDVQALARKYKVEPDALSAWLEYLGIGQPAGLGTPITRELKNANGYDFVQGWIGDQALSVVANSSDQHVRIPGNMPPHSVGVHPTPNLEVGVAWKCLKAESMQLDASITHAHPECGNGVTWSLEIRRGQSVQRLANGVTQGATPVKTAKFDASLRVGDVIALVIGPRDGNHSCDLTNIDLTIRSDSADWNLSKDVSPDILAGNPHADRQGHGGVWHFFSEPVVDSKSQAIPAGSILADWQATTDRNKRELLALDLHKLLVSGPVGAPDAPNSVMHRQITSLNGPLSAALVRLLNTPVGDEAVQDSTIGIDRALFGKHPDGSPVDAGNLCVRAPAIMEVRIPADLAEGAALVAGVSLHQPTGREGSIQAQVLTARPDGSSALKAGPVAEIANRGTWTSSGKRVAHSSPILATPGSAARNRFEASFDDFRRLFPPALCYSKIVPVDEVVTLTLFYREDEPLQRLMLSDAETARLNALWDELHFVSRDALTLVDAYRQILEFATQDADPKVFEPLRQPIMDRAAAYQKQLVETEPVHLAAVLQFAGRAWRRPLKTEDETQLRGLYRQLRSEGLPHDDAIRLTLARVFVAPDFVYRLESAPESTAPGPVSDHELATRLSYFLWSSAPDEELRALADEGRLKDPEVLKAQARRMLKDEKVRRLATEFACQWLQIYDFDRLDEKSEKHFPEFRELRSDMYEEAIRYLTSVFQRDRSFHAIFVSDDTFVNARLAKFYGFKADGLEFTNDRWEQISAAGTQGRGGVLTMAAVLAKQSGASRTSPILRGNWVSEVVLGERLPRPPKGVPPLPEEEAGSELSVRQLVEKHTSDERCSNCHARIDPFGFALEAFDAIGRQRSQDVNGKAIQSTSRVADGTELDGAPGLQKYLLSTREDAVRRQFCRKLLGYALGRSIQLSDELLMSEMQRRLEANENRVGVAIEAIVESRQFREIRGSGAISATP